MSINFIASQELHPYTVELIREAIQECGKGASLEEVAHYCEWAVLHDGGNHLHRDDYTTFGHIGEGGHGTFDPNNSECNGY